MTTGPKPRAMVFGASGFIGRWVARELRARGTSFVAVGRDHVATRELLHRWGAGEAPVVQADLTRPGIVNALIQQYQPAVVFNLAGYGVDRTELDGAVASALNHQLALELAQACAPDRSGVGPTLVHVGSAAEYGAAGGVLREAGPALPTTMYGRSKLAGTEAVGDVAREYGTRAVTARLFTVFGHGEHHGRLFPTLLATARDSHATADLTKGEQHRDFAFVGDAASALVNLADAPFVSGEVVNLASGVLHSVAFFVRVVAERLGIAPSRLRFGALPTRPDEMWHAGVAVDRMQALLGGTLSGDLAEVCARAVRDAEQGVDRDR